MDSLTQITLGAAVGEAVLGKKIGNRAMLWGAVAGTVPDLDVLANFFLDDMDALAFHRGITHSLLFAAVMPFLFGWLSWKFYDSDLYRKKGYKGAAMLIWLALTALILVGINYIPVARGNGINWTLLAAGTMILGFSAWALWTKYYSKRLSDVEAGKSDWLWLWFWTLLTHPLLDAFTPYGTQLFQPFSDMRVAFNSISVVDPLYTLPFLLCLLIAGSLHRNNVWRRRMNWLGIGLSSAYLLFTVYHKISFDSIFRESLESKEIAFQRFTTSPTILNNILWQGVAESDTSYYYGTWSFLEKDNQLDHFVEIPKNHELISGFEDVQDIEILRWFSNGYYNIVRRKDGKLQLNDLRFGGINDDFEKETDYVFRFILERSGGDIIASQTREGNEINSKAFNEFFRKVMATRD